MSDQSVVIADEVALELFELLRWLIDLCEKYDEDRLGEGVWAHVGEGYPRSGLRRDLLRMAMALVEGSTGP
jgi:hypothetical protein